MTGRPRTRPLDVAGHARLDRLTDALRLRRLEQGDLVAALGANQSSLMRWIARGDPKPQPGPAPSRVTTASIAAALGLPVEVFIDPGARLVFVDATGRVLAR